MKKTWILLFTIFVAILSVTACWLSNGKKTNPSIDSKKEIVLRLGHAANLSTSRHIASLKYAQWVAEQTNGQVKIEIFPIEILGSDKQMLELVKSGDLDMTLALTGLVANYAPKIVVAELPFLFSSMDKVTAVLDGPIGDELVKDMPEKGLRCLAYWDNGLRHITNNKQPIEKPEDLKGLKIRTPESKMTMSIFKSLGAAPAPLAWGEVYLALSKGTFDGQENPIANIHGGKLSEVQKYLSITNHKYDTNPLIINEQTWKKLPPNIQQILKDGAVKFALESRQLNQKAEDKLLANLELAGMKVNRPDIEPFRQATQPVYDEWASVIGKELINKVIAAAK